MQWHVIQYRFEKSFTALPDGSVRFISENIDSATLKSLTTIDAGDRVGDY